MFYFLNTSFNQKKSGIEHAQMKRWALFQKQGVPAKIVTRFFALNLHETLKDVALPDTAMINLFDFFGDCAEMPTQNFTIKDLQIKANLQLLVNDQDPNGYMVRNQQRIIQRIKLRAPNFQAVESVSTFDQMGRLVKSEFWDWRGFKSLEQLYDANGAVLVEQVFNPQGKLFYQTFHGHDAAGKAVNTLYRLLDWHGHDYSFNGEQALERFFLDALNQQNGGRNCFIVDRTFELAWSALNMWTPAFKLIYLHSNHLNHPENVLTSALNYNYEYAINNLADWQGVIAPTKQQVRDFQQRFGAQPPAFTIPVGVVPDTIQPVKWRHRQTHKIIMVARLSPEKQQDKVIAAFEKVLVKIPDATLEFWGYANENEGPRLRKIVADKKLIDSITFHDYTLDIGAVYDRAQINVLASNAEGFSLSLLEAESHGVPSVAFDVKYGPAGIIEADRDGLLVPANDVDAFADALLKLLQDPVLLETFSRNAYIDAQRFSETAVWQQWQQVIQPALNFQKGGRN